MNHKNIGKNVRYIRENILGITQFELSKKTKLTPACINQIEKNKRIPSAKTLVVLSKILKVSIDELFMKWHIYE